MSNLILPPPGTPAGDEEIVLMTARGMPALAPARSRDHGVGPFPRMVLRGATVIDGTGAPPMGPIDIVVENGRITQIVSVGFPRLPINPERRPPQGDFEIDCHGKWVTPGFVDSHVHIGNYLHAANGEQAPVEYVYKLWLAHGITTVRDMSSSNGLGWTLQQKAASEANEITAPRIMAYAMFPSSDESLNIIHTPEEGRAWLRAIAERGADGVKFYGASPAIFKAALEESKALGLRSGCHHPQMALSRLNALTTASWGLTSTEHFYGVPEAMFERTSLQPYPANYDFMDEYLRYNSSSQNFIHAAEPGSAKWNETLDRFLELDHTFVPTLAILEANRDLMRARRADWHDKYTHKNLWDFFEPQRQNHGSYWFQWSTRNEVEWKEHFRRWSAFVYDYMKKGGRVCPASDAGFLYQIYGFCFIRDLEWFQEAGFHPLETIRAATMCGAELMGLADEIGTVQVGKCADLLVHQENPLEDLKFLYGTGALRLNDATGRSEWRRGLQYTIRNGVVYDTAELLVDVREIVAQSWAGANIDTLLGQDNV
ncbi:amidohydrolase family protein [Mesorhizobium sp. 43Arga]